VEIVLRGVVPLGEPPQLPVQYREHVRPLEPSQVDGRCSRSAPQLGRCFGDQRMAKSQTQRGASMRVETNDTSRCRAATYRDPSVAMNRRLR
jgi:hypothetical protein